MMVDRQHYYLYLINELFELFKKDSRLYKAFPLEFGINLSLKTKLNLIIQVMKEK